ncbi:Hypothetical protein R9X50_00074200 [Acrodontium crateriforme]|uniref:F-box domain-containing protein n=1 Tax=Acrodontium crateriforme TaxID=150365 RepID=A0AAQ3R7G7_9PEZI|nr:Hypothetical protein R9X50_00074200 [Acrodontium crateriforme]
MADNEAPKPETEAELEAFRARWREEIARKSKQLGEASSNAQSSLEKTQKRRNAPLASSSIGPSITKRPDANDHDDFVPRPYHDLPDKEEQLKLGQDGQPNESYLSKEPISALEHYERAVEKEAQGNLQLSMQHYRKAFKLDDGVHELYKKKHFPPSFFAKQKQTSNPLAANASSGSTAARRHSVHASANSLPSTLKQLVEEFATMQIEAAPPPTDASTQESCPLAELPEEILSQILGDLAAIDVASFARVAQVCKRLAFLVLTEEAIWKNVALGDKVGFKAMHYNYVCDVLGNPIQESDQLDHYLGSYDEETNEDGELELPPTPEERALAYSDITERLLHDFYSSSWRQMFRSRPRIRFNGCYISTVNYTRPGAQASNSLLWGNSVHVVTYFRYLRFFRDGTVISLLSTAEPVDVVHHLVKDNLNITHDNTLPNRVMKDALRGRWRLTSPLSSHSTKSANLELAGDISSTEAPAETEGDIHIETEGVVQRYTYRMLLSLSHAGKAARNNKLAWKGFWSHNRLTDDWGEFGLRNDRAFYWSRVKSYGMGY